MLVLVVVGLGVAALVRLWMTRRRGVDFTPASRPGRRPMTWVILGFNLLMLVWLVAGISTVGNNDCASQTYADACQAGADVGASIGIGLILVVWAFGDVILGVVWMVTRKPQRSCPVCGTTVAVGLTTCPSCGHDFRAAVTGSA